jgi:hippurate hydrolase
VTTTTDPATSRTTTLAEALRGDLVELRRALHRLPELRLDLPLTQQAVLTALEPFDLEVSQGHELSSVTAVLRGRGKVPQGRPRQAVLLRGDMDALPVSEDLPLDYVSQHPGLMHACGHDLHVAALVGAVRILDQLRDELPGDVVFMFQPGEEGGGGAEVMLREGLLEAAGTPVVAAYALHVLANGHALGHWVSRPGPFMAAADEVHVRVLGRGGHGSQPHLALDPIPAACEIVLGLQSMVTRGFDTFDPVLVTVGRIAGGTQDNIIPDHAELAATVRSLSAESRDKVRHHIERLATGIAAAHGLRAEVDFKLGYPVTRNDPEEYELGVEVVRDLFGPGRYTEQAHPDLGSEDMSFVFEQVPGAYLCISACPDDDYANAPDNHSPRAVFDDSVLPDCAAWLAEVALRRLSRW